MVIFLSVKTFMFSNNYVLLFPLTKLLIRNRKNLNAFKAYTNSFPFQRRMGPKSEDGINNKEKKRLWKETHAEYFLKPSERCKRAKNKCWIIMKNWFNMRDVCVTRGDANIRICYIAAYLILKAMPCEKRLLVSLKSKSLRMPLKEVSKRHRQ